MHVWFFTRGGTSLHCRTHPPAPLHRITLYKYDPAVDDFIDVRGWAGKLARTFLADDYPKFPVSGRRLGTDYVRERPVGRVANWALLAEFRSQGKTCWLAPRGRPN